MSGLGTLIESALSKVGITEDKLAKLLGKSCGCSDRRDKLDNLTIWARRVLSGKVKDAERHLEEVISDE